MSKLSAAVAKASRRFKDVPVVLNGELQAERNALVGAVAAAGLAPQRLTVNSDAVAARALDEWDAAHAGEVLTVRVFGCIGAEWPTIRRKNPVAKNQADRDLGDARIGFDLVGAAIDAIEAYGGIVDGDVVERPEPGEWADFFAAVGTADMTVLTQAVLEVNAEPTGQAFGDLVKA